MLELYAAKARANLKKTVGMLNRIEKMIDENRYCVDIAQQVNAAIGFLRQTNNLILENHLNTCGGSKLSARDKDEKDRFVKELIQAFTVAGK
ncbi:metal-sensing transcriptional repressor [Candidatus Peregrinibacteria bacterium]|nr:metal-sensing transcriptional repressor [Candidatus Peregrinibacteria bacterium]